MNKYKIRTRRELIVGDKTFKEGFTIYFNYKYHNVICTIDKINKKEKSIKGCDFLIDNKVSTPKRFKLKHMKNIDYVYYDW